MVTNKLNAIAVFLVLAATSFAAGGCQTDTPLGPLSISSVPPDLRYMPPETIRSAMWVLAAEIEELEQLLEGSRKMDSVARSGAIVGTLQRMQAAAKSLEQPGRSTQHPVLNRNLDTFVSRVNRAKRAAERSPPNYFLASSVAGSCFICHGKNTAYLRRGEIGMVD